MAQPQQSAESSRIGPVDQIIVLPYELAENNHRLDPNPSLYSPTYHIILEFFRNSEVFKALTDFDDEIPELYIRQWWTTCQFIPERKGVVGNVDAGAEGGSGTIRIGSSTLRRTLGMKTRTELGIAAFEKPPNNTTLFDFLRFLGYNKEITRIGAFKRQNLPPFWNFMFSTLNRTLTGKSGSQDQATTEILQIMYGLFFRRNLNFAGILYQDLLSAVNVKTSALAKGGEVGKHKFLKNIKGAFGTENGIAEK